MNALRKVPFLVSAGVIIGLTPACSDSPEPAPVPVGTSAAGSTAAPSADGPSGDGPTSSAPSTQGLTTAGPSDPAPLADGTVASVAGVEIPQDRLDAVVDAALAEHAADIAADPAEPDREDVTRRTLTQLIHHELLAGVNAGLDRPVTEEQAAVALDTTEATRIGRELLVPTAELPARITDILVLSELLSETISATSPVSVVTVTMSMIAYPERKEALEELTRYRNDPDAYQDLVTSGVAGRENITVTTNLDAALIPTGLFGSPVGSMFVLTEDGTSLVARIDKRDITSAALPSGMDLTDPLTAQGIGGLILADTVDAATGVTVSPDIGVWDPVTAQVIENRSAE